MPTIGWFEILIVVAIAIIVLGPKDFPVMLKSLGSWISSLKKYFSNIQREISTLESSVDENIELDNNYTNKTEFKKKDE